MKKLLIMLLILLCSSYGIALAAPSIQTPAPGSTLSGATQTFGYTADGQSVIEWWLYAGTSVGANNLYDSGRLGASSTSHTMSGLPTNGSTVHVRLWYKVSGSGWSTVDYTYTAAGSGGGGGPTINSPSPGSTLPGTSATFNYTAGGTNVTEWWLYVGTSVGAKNVHDSGSLGTATSHNVSGLPTNGSTLHVRLWYRVSGNWLSKDFTYTAAGSGGGGGPTINSPSPGSTLSGSSTTFNYTAGGTNVTEWWLYVGTSVGAKNVHDSGSLGTATSHNVSGLPTNGSTLHVRLWYFTAGDWSSKDFTYTASGSGGGGSGGPRITSPSPGSTLSGSSTTFNYTAGGTNVTKWWIWAGSSQGTKTLHDSGTLGTATSHTISALPTNGSTIHITLFYQVSGGGTWFEKHFSYKAPSSLVGPNITSPSQGGTLPGTSATFNYTANGTSVTEWSLYVGTSPGANNIHNSGSLGTSTSHFVSGLPNDGDWTYVRLRYRVSGTWLHRDFSYLAINSGTPPKITSPSPGSTLPGSSVTFVYNAGTEPVTGWWFEIGSSFGTKNLHDSGPLGSGTTSYRVNGLPTNGSTVYVRFWYKIEGTWEKTDYTYTAN